MAGQWRAWAKDSAGRAYEVLKVPTVKEPQARDYLFSEPELETLRIELERGDQVEFVAAELVDAGLLSKSASAALPSVAAQGEPAYNIWCGSFVAVLIDPLAQRGEKES